MENIDNKTYIERIDIEGLWGRFDVNWALHSDVNILVGENGTGKSTILRILLILVKHSLLVNKNISTQLSRIDFYFKNKGVSQKSKCQIVQTGRVGFDEKYYQSQGNEWFIESNYINTFENELLDRSVIQKIANNDVRTSLDFTLYNLEQLYWKYQIELYERIVEQNLDKEKVNANHRLFVEKVNHFFSITGKTFAQRRDTKALVFKEKQTELSLYQLSSGEKQLLIILLTVLLEDQKPFVLLMDEPEISLHLNWQDELIEVIRELNPNCQIIIATHSPSLFSDGWNDRIFWMEDICKPIQSLETA